MESSLAAPLPPARAGLRLAGTLLLLLAILALGLINALVFSSSNQLNDDAFIFLRYADNLLAGHGLTWNPGGEWVEGYSSLLYVLVVGALRSASDRDPVELLQLLNIGLYLALLVLLTGLTARLQRGFRPAACLSALLVAGSGTFGHWARSGMETMLFADLIVLACLVQIGEDRKDPGGLRGLLSGLLFGLTALCRPEGILVFAGVLGARLLRRDASGSRFSRTDAWRLLTVVAIALMHVLWRYYRYDELAPNTYYAKVAYGTWPVDRGFRGLLDFTAGYSGALTLLALVLAARVQGRRSGRFLATQLGGWALYFTVYLALPNWSAAYVMPLVLCSAIGVGWLLPATLPSNDPGERGHYGLRLLVGSAALVLWFTAAHPAAARQLIHDRASLTWTLMDEPDDGLINHFIWIGKRMAQIAGPGETLVVGACGAIPYYSGMITYDSLGLNDRHIAHTPMPEQRTALFGHEKGDGEYLLDLEPTYLIATPRRMPQPFKGHPGVEKSFVEIYASPRFQQQYEPIHERTPDGRFFNYWKRRAQ